jgi:glutathione S-transferase
VGVAERLLPADGHGMFGRWCIADTDLAMMLWRLWRTGHRLPEKVEAFAATQWERPSVREFATHQRPQVFARSV